MQRARYLPDGCHRYMHKGCQVDQIHIDEAERIRQRRKCCLQHAGLTDSQTLLGQPEGRTKAPVEQSSGLVAERPIGLAAGGSIRNMLTSPSEVRLSPRSTHDGRLSPCA